MSLFKSNKPAPVAPAVVNNSKYTALAELTLNSITDGVLLVDETGVIQYTNPAAATMLGYDKPDNVIGLGYQAVLRLETDNGESVSAENSALAQAFKVNQNFSTREYLLVSPQSERHAAIALSLIPTGNAHTNRIITFRDITKELEDEHEQSEFISTASHEMRTPVASIEGYLGLALNPQTATIDARARQYLEAAHASSQHLGRLFKDLLDVTKLDDGRQKLHEVPVDIIATVRDMAGSREKDMEKKHLKYSFGASGPVNGDKQVEQLVYAAVDLDFLREILDNLIDNAIKYTPEGGEIWINARGDGDKVLVNVTDTGIGISPDDAAHVFQKFYRVDNSQTRQIGGTGLGLYLVKQRVEAMGGRVWVESAFGDGSTFFFSLPRLSDSEYRKRKLAYDNEQAVQAFSQGKGIVTATGVIPPEQVAKMQVEQKAPVQNVNARAMNAVQIASTPVGAQNTNVQRTVQNNSAPSVPTIAQVANAQPTAMQAINTQSAVAQAANNMQPAQTQNSATAQNAIPPEIQDTDVVTPMLNMQSTEEVPVEQPPTIPQPPQMPPNQNIQQAAQPPVAQTMQTIPNTDINLNQKETTI